MSTFQRDQHKRLRRLRAEYPRGTIMTESPFAEHSPVSKKKVLVRKINRKERRWWRKHPRKKPLWVIVPNNR